MYTPLSNKEIEKLGLSSDAISAINEGKHNFDETITLSKIINDRNNKFKVIFQRYKKIGILESDWKLQTIIKNKSDKKYYSVITHQWGSIYFDYFEICRISFLNVISIMGFGNLHIFFKILKIIFWIILICLLLGIIGQLAQIYPARYFIVASISPTLIYLISFSKLFKKINSNISANIFKIFSCFILVCNFFCFISITSVPIREFFNIDTFNVYIYDLYIIIILAMTIINCILIKKSFDKIITNSWTQN